MIKTTRLKFTLGLLLLLVVPGCSLSISEKLKELIGKKEYEKCLSSVKDAEELTDFDLYQASSCVNGLLVQLKKESRSNSSFKISSIKNKERSTGLKIIFNDKTSPPYIQIEDPYFNKISKGNYFKDKALIEKFLTLSELNDPGENVFLLIEILKIDPGLFPDEFPKVILSSFKANIISSLPDEEREKFINLIHYISTKDTNDFSRRFSIVDGTNVNIRSGPGTENMVVDHLTEESVFQIDSDYNTITLAGKTGKWTEIYIWSKDTRGWIFSGFLKKATADQNRIDAFKRDLTKVAPLKVIEFDNWTGEEIPDGFNGNYYRTERQIKSGKIGYPLYSSKQENFICSPVPKKPSKIIVSFEIVSESKLTLFKIKGNVHGKNKKLFDAKLDSNHIQINDNRFLVKEKGTEHFDFEFTDESTIKVTGSLGNKGSEVKLPKYWSEASELEFCIQSSPGNSPGGILYFFKIF